MREVIIKSTTQKDLIKHQSDAKTFGELKKELPNITWNGMRVVERSTKTTLQMNEAVLPQGDFILFLVPEKVKSGTKKEGGIEKLDQPINECSYNKLRSHMSWLNRNKDAKLDVSGSTDDLKKRLKKYMKKMETSIDAPKTTKKKPVEKEKKKVVSGIVERIAKKAKETNGASDNVKEIIKNSKAVIVSAIDEILDTIEITSVPAPSVASATPSQEVSIEPATGILGTNDLLEYNAEKLENEIQFIKDALKSLQQGYSKIA